MKQNINHLKIDFSGKRSKCLQLAVSVEGMVLLVIFWGQYERNIISGRKGNAQPRVI